MQRSPLLLVALLAACGTSEPDTLPLPNGGQPDLPPDVWTQHNDNYRTGANLHEALLNTTNVNVGTFGKLFSMSVDGWIWTQPLYLSNVEIGGKTHNVIVVGSDRATLYAFDADAPGMPLWKTSLGAWFPIDDLQLAGEWGPIEEPPRMGINSTPVIDVTAGTIYVVTKTKVAGLHIPLDKRFVHQLHAIDIHTGQERPSSPVPIEAAVQGTGDGTLLGRIAFDQRHEFNRPSLLLSQGTIYIGFASHADTDPYHGWILAYDAATLRQVGAFNDTPSGRRGGIWQSGQPPAADDDGDIYFTTGNGSFNRDQPGGTDLGDSIIRLHKDGEALTVAGWFTPYNQAELDKDDLDLGVNGPLLLPGTRLLVSGSKTGHVYLLDRDAMGSFDPEADHVVERFVADPSTDGGAHLHGSAVYWEGPSGRRIYLWGENDYLKSFLLQDGSLVETPCSQSVDPVPAGMPGAMLSLSAYQGQKATGIVWANHAYGVDGTVSPVPGILQAFDAEDLQKELWNSNQDPSGRDVLPTFAKFTYPTIANGKVYMATFSEVVVVYGLLPTQTP